MSEEKKVEDVMQAIESFTFLDVDQIAVLEEEFVEKRRPYPAYLMRKILSLIKPSWGDEHPQYKKMV